MIRRPPRSTHCISSAASDVYKRQVRWSIQYKSNHLSLLIEVPATFDRRKPLNPKVKFQCSFVNNARERTHNPFQITAKPCSQSLQIMQRRRQTTATTCPASVTTVATTESGQTIIHFKNARKPGFACKTLLGTEADNVRYHRARISDRSFLIHTQAGLRAHRMAT